MKNVVGVLFGKQTKKTFMPVSSVQEVLAQTKDELPDPYRLEVRVYETESLAMRAFDGDDSPLYEVHYMFGDTRMF